MTLGFAECLRLVISYEGWLTRGMLGVWGSNDRSRGWWPRGWGDTGFLLLALLAVLIVYTALQALARSPSGALCVRRATTPALWKRSASPCSPSRVRVFAIGGAILGLAGSLRAFYYSYIDPTQFGPIITAYAFMAVVVGGRGSNRGVVASAFTLIFLLEGSRFLIDLVLVLGRQNLPPFACSSLAWGWWYC